MRRRSPARARPLAAFVAAVVTVSALLTTAPPASAAGSSFAFHGGGFGHGVGMSQFGARGQGDAGRSYDQILSSYYPGTYLQWQNPPGPTVLLAPSSCSGVAQATSTTLAPVGGSIVISVGTPSGLANITAVPSGATVTVANAGPGAYQITGGDNPGTYAASFVMVALNGTPTRLGMTDVRYRWGRLVLKEAGTGLNAYAQDMTMDQYLYGLAEVPSSWPVATLQAQAVAGRTYAERVAGPRRAQGAAFHVYGSVSDQCYRGWEKEAEATYGQRWRAAVDATSGVVLRYGDTLAHTFYSSSNGGFSERSGYVFTQDLPYLPAQPDPYDNATGNTLHRWTRTFDGDTLGGLIGGGVGRVTSITASSGAAGQSGRVNRVTFSVSGASGTTTLTGAQLRSRLGLPDTLLFSIVRDGTTTLYGQAANQLPAGSFDSATPSGASAVVAGWAADPDNAAAVEIHAYVNGGFAGYGRADKPRPDVGQAFPQYGANRGFSFSIPIPVGTSSVCTYAIDPSYPNVNRGLGCRSVTSSANSLPFGNYEAILRSPGGAIVQGWTIDPDTTGPIEVHAWAGGQVRGGAVASIPRSDVQGAYPAYGANHGFSFTASLPPGTHNVCAFAINAPAGNNPQLGCRSIEISPQPLGNLDALVRSGSTVSVQGWAFDPDTAQPVEVHVLADGVLAGYGTAASFRSDIGAAFPVYGPNHGFAFNFAVSPGPHRMCAYAINVGPGVNRFLGCLDV